MAILHKKVQSDWACLCLQAISVPDVCSTCDLVENSYIISDVTVNVASGVQRICWDCSLDKPGKESEVNHSFLVSTTVKVIKVSVTPGLFKKKWVACVSFLSVVFDVLTICSRVWICPSSIDIGCLVPICAERQTQNPLCNKPASWCFTECSQEGQAFVFHWHPTFEHLFVLFKSNLKKILDLFFLFASHCTRRNLF